MDTVFGAYRAAGSCSGCACTKHSRISSSQSFASFELGNVWGPVLATVASWTTALVHRILVLPRWIRFRVARSALREGQHPALPELRPVAG